ncbi:MAG: murein L,D-transpeptidase family protein [Bdellovibrionales bacterium]
MTGATDKLPIMRFLALFFIVTLTGAMGYAQPPEELYPENLLQISATAAFSKYVFLVDKQKRKLFVYERDGENIKKIEELNTDIGKNNGKKERENDHKTPEGIYFFQEKKTQPEIPFKLYGRMAFTMDYPNLFDRRDGKTGYGIWLHSVPDDVPLTRGSRGCVVVRNDEIARLEKYIEFKQTPILIFDQVKYVPLSEHKKLREKRAQFLQKWIDSWQSKDVDQYMSFYDPTFTAPGFNYKTWRRHKEKLKDKYSFIQVRLDQPFLLIHNDQLIVRTLQKYTSDKHTDYGVKVIYAVIQNEEYKIIREEWTEARETGETLTGSEARDRNPSTFIQSEEPN